MTLLPSISLAAARSDGNSRRERLLGHGRVAAAFAWCSTPLHAAARAYVTEGFAAHALRRTRAFSSRVRRRHSAQIEQPRAEEYARRRIENDKGFPNGRLNPTSLEPRYGVPEL